MLAMEGHDLIGELLRFGRLHVIEALQFLRTECRRVGLDAAQPVDDARGDLPFARDCRSADRGVHAVDHVEEGAWPDVRESNPPQIRSSPTLRREGCESSR